MNASRNKIKNERFFPFTLRRTSRKNVERTMSVVGARAQGENGRQRYEKKGEREHTYKNRLQEQDVRERTYLDEHVEEECRSHTVNRGHEERGKKEERGRGERECVCMCVRVYHVFIKRGRSWTTCTHIHLQPPLPPSCISPLFLLLEVVLQRLSEDVFQVVAVLVVDEPVFKLAPVLVHPQTQERSDRLHALRGGGQHAL